MQFILRQEELRLTRIVVVVEAAAAVAAEAVCVN